MTPLLRPTLLLLVLLLAAGGCVSAERAYRDGMEAEVAGDYDAAVRRYAAALRRDASLPNVRGRLVVASREAVRQHLAAAAVAPGPVARADAWLAADAVVAEAATAGVDAERPPTFDADRDAALDAATSAVLDGAAADVDARDYARALAALDGAGRYRPSPARLAEMHAMRRDALRRWTEDDLAAGRYRAALAHADAALADGAGPDEPLFRDLRARILADGARRVVVLPAEDDGGYPRGWADALDDALDERLAGRPFLDFADPADTRRLIARGGAPRAPLARAAWLADRMGAELAVVVRVDAAEADERRSDRRRVAARLRDSRDTTSYVRERVDLRVATTAELTVLHAGDRDPACSDRVTATGDGRWTRATYRGAWRSLELDRDERALFEDERADNARRDAFDEAADALAERVARRAEDCLMTFVP